MDTYGNTPIDVEGKVDFGMAVERMMRLSLAVRNDFATEEEREEYLAIRDLLDTVSFVPPERKDA
jgi:hypothetical protein